VGYRALLAVPGGPAFSAASFVLRLPISMQGLGTLFLVLSTTGSYGLAGAAVATVTLTQAFVGPLVGRVVDRVGQTRVIVPAVFLNGAGLALLLTLALRHGPVWTLFPAAVLYGAPYPPMGSLVRARWAYALAGRAELTTALSLEAVLDELIFITGPPLVTVLATGVHPAAGLLAAYTFAVIGTVGLVLQRRTEPPRSRPDGTRRRAPIRLPDLRVLIGVAIALGLVFGSIEVGVAGFTAEHGSPGAAGFVLALVAAGSMIAGLIYGGITWRAPLRRRQLIGVLVLPVAVGGLAAAPNPVVLAGLGMIAGASFAPSLIALLGLTEERVPAASRTEGMALVLAGINAGVAIGAASAGRLIDAAGARPALLIAPAAGLAALLVVVAGGRWLAGPRGVPEVSVDDARISG
jgi:MFS family permease